MTATNDSDFARQPYLQTSSFDGVPSPRSFAMSGPTMAARPGSTRHSMTDFLGTKWPRLFCLVVAVQALICMAFEAIVFGRFQTSLGVNPKPGDDFLKSQYKSIPTFLTLIIFGFLYQIILTWDALRLKNTIQVIGLSVSNIAFLVYTALQIDQIHQSIEFLKINGALEDNHAAQTVWDSSQPFLVAIPIIIAVGAILMAWISWKLYREFAWDILKQIGADYRMKKRFLHYQIYIALLKFDFFFFLGFTVQFLVIVTGKTDIEFGLTIAAIPVTIAILLFAAFFTQRENKTGMCIIVLLYFGGLAYFCFKLVRIYQPGHAQNYEAVKKSLTAFAVLTILLIILTIINAFVCMSNFGNGLKNHLVKAKGVDMEKENVDSYQLQDQKPPVPTRMTID